MIYNYRKALGSLPGYFSPRKGAIVLAGLLVLTMATPSWALVTKPQVKPTLSGHAEKEPLAPAAPVGSIAEKVNTWLLLNDRPQDASFAKFKTFMEANPLWPNRGKFEEAAEQEIPTTLFFSDYVAWFGAHKPRSMRGLLLYINALKKEGDSAGAAAEIKKSLETIFLSDRETRDLVNAYGSIIGKDVLAHRADRLMWRGRASEVDALVPFLSRDQQALFRARLGVATSRPNVSALLANVPASLKNNEGLLFERVKYRLEREDYAGAAEITLHAPISPENADFWWKQKHILSREALKKKDFKLAYNLADHHHMTTGADFASAEFHLGWIALRFLHQPLNALSHFENMAKAVATPTSYARAAYWAGRAISELSQPDIAQAWYQTAAGFPTTFYGQAARQTLHPAPPLVTLGNPVVAPEDKAAFDASELVRAVKHLKAHGRSKHLNDAVDAFLAKILSTAKEPKDYAMIAGLAYTLDAEHFAVKASKEFAQNLKKSHFESGYPVLRELPRIKPERALIHAVIRQESNFNKKAVSPAGAVGMMQLLPSTAKQEAKRNRVPFNLSALTSNPDYNINLGSSYLQYLIDKYNGAAVLAIAAYNAGPRNVNNWLDTYGDPRTGAIDWLDWMELIPLYETRNYVQRVLEGTYVYHMRFAQKPKVLYALR